MTKIEALKELLKANLNEVNNSRIGFCLSVSFQNEEFVVEYKIADKTILSGKITDYDLSLGGQKRFVLDIANKLYKFVTENEILKYRGLLDCYDEKELRGFFNSYELIYAHNYYIIKRNCLEMDKVKICKENIWIKYSNKRKCLYEFFDTVNIKIGVGDDLRVIYGLDYDCYHVLLRMYENSIWLNYINCEDNNVEEYLKNKKDIMELADRESFTFYYGRKTIKEAKRVANYIEPLLYKKPPYYWESYYYPERRCRYSKYLD